MVKTLTIRDEVYRKLLAMKSKDESFSELFDRLVEKQSPIEVLKRLRGSLEFNTPAEKEEFIHDVTARRDEWRL